MKKLARFFDAKRKAVGIPVLSVGIALTSLFVILSIISFSPVYIALLIISVLATALAGGLLYGGVPSMIMCAYYYSALLIFFSLFLLASLYPDIKLLMLLPYASLAVFAALSKRVSDAVSLVFFDLSIPEEVIKNIHAVYTRAADEFSKSAGVSSSRGAYYPFRDGSTVTFFNVTCRGRQMASRPKLLTVSYTGEKASDSSYGKLTDSLRRCPYSTLAATVLDTDSGIYNAYAYYDPRYANRVFDGVSRAIKSSRLDCSCKAEYDAKWSKASQVSPSDGELFRVYNAVMLSEAGDDIIDKPECVFFAVVFKSLDEMKAFVDRVCSMGFEAFYAYKHSDDYSAIITRGISLNADSLTACTDSVCDIASIMNGRITDYGYGFDRKNAQKEYAEYENLL